MEHIEQFLKDNTSGKVVTFMGESITGFDHETLLLFAEWVVGENKRLEAREFTRPVIF